MNGAKRRACDEKIFQNHLKHEAECANMLTSIEVDGSEQ